MSDKYREAGVDPEAGYESVRLIRSHIARTEVRGAIDSIGAFGGMSDPSVLNMKELVLVSRTDDVGTKLLVTLEMDRHGTVGVDAVVMCVNDALVRGIAPIFFLDYLAVGKNEPKKIKQLVKGAVDGCMQAECILIDGETAEMPDVCGVGHYDIAGFCVGAMDKCNLLDEQKIEEDNVLINLPSTGVYSSRFPLICKVLLKNTKLDLHKECEEIENRKLEDILLTLTKIYAKAIKHLLGEVDIKGMSHITGGGFHESVPRMLKEEQGVTIDITARPHKPTSDTITKYGNAPMDEMCDIFNMDIGFMMTVDKKDVDTVQSLLEKIHEKSHVISEVTNSGNVDVK